MKKALLKFITLSFFASIATPVFSSVDERNLQGALGNLQLTPDERDQALTSMRAGTKAVTAVHEIVRQRHERAAAQAAADHADALARLQGSHAADIAARTAREEALQRQLEGLDQQLRNLQRRIDQHGADEAHWRQTLAEKQALHDRLQAELRRIHMERDAQGSLEGALRGELGILQGTIRDLQGHLQRHEGNEGYFTQQLTQAQEREETLRRRMVGRGNRAKAKLGALHRRNAQLNEQIRTLQAQIAAVQRAIDPGCHGGACRQRNQAAEDKAARLERDLATVRAQLAALEATHAATGTQIQDLGQRNAQYETHLRQTREQLATAQQEATGLQREIEKMKREHSHALDRHVQDFTQRAAAYDHRIQELETLLAQLRQEVQTAGQDSGRVSAENQRLLRQVHNLEEANQTLIRQMGDLQIALKEAEGVSNGAKEDLRKTKEGLSKALENLNLQTAEFQRRLAEAQQGQPPVPQALQELDKIRKELARKTAALTLFEEQRGHQEAEFQRHRAEWERESKELKRLLTEAERKTTSPSEKAELVRRAEEAERDLEQLRATMQRQSETDRQQAPIVYQELREVQAALEAERETVTALQAELKHAPKKDAMERLRASLAEAQGLVQTHTRDLEERLQEVRKATKLAEQHQMALQRQGEELMQAKKDIAALEEAQFSAESRAQMSERKASHAHQRAEELAHELEETKAHNKELTEGLETIRKHVLEGTPLIVKERSRSPSPNSLEAVGDGPSTFASPHAFGYRRGKWGQKSSRTATDVAAAIDAEANDAAAIDA